jgi:hypothetical protein
MCSPLCFARPRTTATGFFLLVKSNQILLFFLTAGKIGEKKKFRFVSLAVGSSFLTGVLFQLPTAAARRPPTEHKI